MFVRIRAIRPLHRWLLAVGFVASASLIAVGASLALRGGGGAAAAADPGAQACRMMAADKAAGATPDGARSAREARLLEASRNARLRAAAANLTDDVFNAIDDLYAGCASIGVPLG